MTGLSERTVSNVLARLFKLGLLASDTPKGPVQFRVPLPALSPEVLVGWRRYPMGDLTQRPAVASKA